MRLDPDTAPRGLRYQPALDGLRAVAVTAVVCYHGFAQAADSPGRGGFLGVDLFFVLSGYLITSLLVVEYGRSGRIGVRSFWSRRVRRLFPALVVTLVLLAIYAVLVPSVRNADRVDAFFTLAYAQNWHFVWAHGNFTPTPLSHTWSLSIEEQWYLVWPAALWAGLRWTKARPLVLFSVVSALALASTIWMRVLYSPLDTARAFFGTDTRAQELLVGAAIALLLGNVASFTRPAVRHAVEVAGWCAAAFLGYELLRARDSDRFLYHGGFLAIAVATGVVIVAATRSNGILRRALSVKPMIFIGAISYGIYLYHIPLQLIISPERSGLSGTTLFAARVGCTVVLAALSYRYVERPIRDGTLSFARVPVLVPVALVAVAAVVLVSTLSVPNEPSSTHLSPQTIAYLEQRRAASPPRDERVLVAGEAQAFVLEQRLRAGYSASGFTGLSFGLYGCGIGAGDIYVGSDRFTGQHGCGDWPDAYRQVVDAYRPDVVVLMVGDQEVFDRAVGDDLLLVGTSAWSAMFIHQLDTARRALVADGARLVVATNPCPSSSDTGDAFSSAERDQARLRAVNSTLRDYAALRHVQLVDLASVLCPGGQPLRRQDGVVISREPAGLTRDGAQFVWAWLSSQLKASVEPGPESP